MSLVVEKDHTLSDVAIAMGFISSTSKMLLLDDLLAVSIAILSGAVLITSHSSRSNAQIVRRKISANATNNPANN
jgi:hypothetical protein